MLIVMKSDHALKSGRIVRKGESVDLPDAEAYKLVHAGAATPPVRYRVACESLLIGTMNHVRDDVVDVPAGVYDPSRFYQLVAVVPGEDFALFDGVDNQAWSAGVPTLAPPALALEMVEKGGRYATKKEADSLGWPEPHPSSFPAIHDVSEIPAPAGPSKKVCFLTPTQHVSGVVAQPGDIFDVPDAEADALIKSGRAEAAVKVRVACDGIVVGTTNYLRGDVVEVAGGMADDPDRFEPLDGRKPKDAPAPSSRFGS